VKTIEEERKNKNIFFKNSPHSPLTPEQKATFVSLNYFPVNEHYKYTVKLKKYNTQEEISILTSTGQTQQYLRYAYVEFKVGSEVCSLTVYKQINSDYLFIPFKDKTSGKQTYGAGRYIELEKKNRNEYILDFNLAYNPYCAYNELWTCPLTPFENILKVEILAGEKSFH